MTERRHSIESLGKMLWGDRHRLDDLLPPFDGAGSADALTADAQGDGTDAVPDAATVDGDSVVSEDADGAENGVSADEGEAAGAAEAAEAAGAAGAAGTVEAAAEASLGRDVELGWVTGVLPSPFRDDHYIVQFLDNGQLKILAYVDGFGRAFSTDKAIIAPPAREPDLAMQHFGQVEDDENEDGCILVKGEGGERRRVATYEKRDGAYAIFDSWYDFSGHDEHLSYIEIMTRAYIACVYRPTLTGIPVPSSGLTTIHELLGASNAVRGLRAVELLVQRSQLDSALKPPALAVLLCRWLEDSGFTLRTSHAWLWSMEDESDNGPLRLIRTRRYANMYYLALEDENADISPTKIWALESALNRFLLIEETLKDKAPSASIETCLATDELIRDIIAVQAPRFERAGTDATAVEGGIEVDAEVDDGVDDDADATDDAEAAVEANAADGADSVEGEDAADDAADTASATSEPEARRLISTDGGEWELRLAIARALEEVRVPYRFEAVYSSDVTEPGVAAFLLTTPGANLMAREHYSSDTESVEALTLEEREGEALDYACNLAVIMAATAFDASSALREVVVSAQPHDDEMAPLLFQLRFSREALGRWQESSSGLVMDGEAFVAEFSEEPWIEPFAVITSRDVATYRREAPEIGGKLLAPENRRRLGARSARELRINYDANLRFVANRLAGALSRATSIQDAIHMVRDEQNATGNAYVYEGCTNVMRALTQGSVEPSDRAAIEACFVGRDAMGEALSQARSFMTIDPNKAADIISEAIDQAESSGRFVDTGEAVHRMFDSYVSRVIYNLHNSDGRTVELLPTSLVMAYLDAINLLDQSFSKSEQAVAYGRRCIELAPTFTLAYRRCARAYMLVGDLDEAARLLTRCLGLATLPEEIAMAYYQLAYVKWKGGYGRDGLACYCKSIMTSPIYAAQASMELRELMREEGLEFVPGEDIDGVLEAAGIPLAPTTGLLDELGGAIEAAVEENLFAVARSLLLVYLRHRPDDALADLLRSLEDVGAEAD